MSAFVTAIFSFPNVVFTVPLLLATLYWLLVIVGAADLDLLDGADGLADGAAHGALEAADGAVDGAADGVADGVADGAAEAGAHGAHEALDGVHHAAEGGAFTILHALKLRNAPVTVVLSLFVAYGWLISGVTDKLLFGDQIPPFWPGLGVLVGTLPVALLATSLTVRPLGVIFRGEGSVSRRHLIGGTATISTGWVDGRFGQAVCVHSGAEQVLQVRCDRPNQLKKGDEVLLVSFDTPREAFVVEPLHAAGAAAQTPSTQSQGRPQSWTSTS